MPTHLPILRSVIWDATSGLGISPSSGSHLPVQQLLALPSGWVRCHVCSEDMLSIFVNPRIYITLVWQSPTYPVQHFLSDNCCWDTELNNEKGRKLSPLSWGKSVKTWALIFSSKVLPCDRLLSIPGISLHLDTVLKCRGKHTEIGKVPFGVVRFSVLSRMNGKSGELLLVYSIRAYPRRYARRSKEKKPPGKEQRDHQGDGMWKIIKISK